MVSGKQYMAVASSKKTALNRQPLHIEVAALVREMIKDGSLKQGEHIKEIELCEQLAVSRTPLREALKALHVEGLVHIETNRGSWVSKISAQEYLDAFEVMSSLERKAAELMTERASDQQLKELFIIHQQMENYFQQKDKKNYFEKNQQIHSSIIRASGNQKLCQLHQQLLNLVTYGRFQAINSDYRWKESMQEHQDLIKALLQRDGKKAGELLSTHVMHTGHVLAKMFEQA